MKQFRHLEFSVPWKDCIANINPNIAAYHIRDDNNFILAWEQENIIVQKEFNQKDLFQFIERYDRNYRFGYVSYDAKNKFEKKLSSKNQDEVEFPEAIWFTPKHILISNNGECSYSGDLDNSQLKSLLNDRIQLTESNVLKELQGKTNFDHYSKNFYDIQAHLKRGDIYEINYCTTFRASSININPLHSFIKLNENTEAPFSCFFKWNEYHILSGSPERFIQRDGDFLISQPIKGTARRDENPETDEKLSVELLLDKKELAENIMIVDLVRNDLSKIAVKNSVKVKELNSLHTFKSVHQLISTISCKVQKDASIEDIFSALFPMGSMTGAPKFRAMEIIEKIEDFKRGVYSGTVGILEPNGNFDFNVVIRTILYNQDLEQLHIPVGGAITSLSNCNDEYNECLTKLEATHNALC